MIIKSGQLIWKYLVLLESIFPCIKTVILGTSSPMFPTYILYMYICFQTNTAPRGMQYTTFMPGPVPPPQVPNPTYSAKTLGPSQHHQTFVSLPMSSRTQVSFVFQTFPFLLLLLLVCPFYRKKFITVFWWWYKRVVRHTMYYIVLFCTVVES